MKLAVCIGVACAIVIHVGILAFGGLVFGGLRKDAVTTQQVELLGAEEPEKPAEEPEVKAPVVEPEEIQTDAEAPPDAAEIIKSLEMPQVDSAPALDAASLSAIEAALNGASGGGDFAQSIDFASGGRIGGTGKAGALEESVDHAFSMAEIDQRPRVVMQSAPLYPSELRGKKVEGVVTLLFVVDSAGAVTTPRVESSSNAAFEKPALDAVKKWKFEPAIKAGQRVHCKMRVPIRFQPS